MVVHFYCAGLVVLTLALAGCSGTPGIAPFETSEILLPASAKEGAAAHTPTALAPEAGPTCPPMSPAVIGEAQRYTPFTPDWRQALVLSEIQKNRALAEALAAYEVCRKS